MMHGISMSNHGLSSKFKTLVVSTNGVCRFAMWYHLHFPPYLFLCYLFNQCSGMFSGGDCNESWRKAWDVWWGGGNLCVFFLKKEMKTHHLMLQGNIFQYFFSSFHRWRTLYPATCQHTRLTFPRFTQKDLLAQIQSMFFSLILMKEEIPSSLAKVNLQLWSYFWSLIDYYSKIVTLASIISSWESL